MKPVDILREFYDPSSSTFKMLLIHGRAVAAKALAITNSLPALNLDASFIEEAALLHDIGIFLTHTPDLGCAGVHPYVSHGYLGRKLLEEKGLFRHALVCERHVGVGISAADIDLGHLPLPRRDMRPVSIEEEIICYADKFFSKSETGNGKEKSIADILAGLAPYGRDKVDRFLSWLDRFGNPKVPETPIQPAGTPSPWQDEFALISRLLNTGAPGSKLHPALREAPGDDACLLQALSNPVVTTDTQREGIHFRFDWQTPEEIGRKAVSVTLSDLAASYANPAALFINLCLPRAMNEETILRVYQGIHQGLDTYGCALGGGNTSIGNCFALDLFAIGQGREDIFPTRSTAKPGFGLYVTGPLGLARAGLEALQRKDTDFPGLIRRFKAPVARFDAATVLATHGVRCVMDISDGLAGDARHIAKASNLSIDIDFHLGESTVNEELSSFCRRYGLDPTIMAVSGGEDYELLFACPPETFTRIAKMLPEVFQVGHCLDYQGQHLVGNAAGISSFQHG